MPRYTPEAERDLLLQICHITNTKVTQDQWSKIAANLGSAFTASSLRQHWLKIRLPDNAGGTPEKSGSTPKKPSDSSTPKPKGKGADTPMSKGTINHQRSRHHMSAHSGAGYVGPYQNHGRGDPNYNSEDDSEPEVSPSKRFRPNGGGGDEIVVVKDEDGVTVVKKEAEENSIIVLS